MTTYNQHNSSYIDTGVNIDTMIKMATAQDAEKGDFRVKSGQLCVNENGLLGMREIKDNYALDLANNEFSPAPLNLTGTAIGHMASKLGIHHGKAFLTGNELPTHITADTLNHFIEREPEKDWLIRGYGANARAALSNRYLIMDHNWVLNQVRFFLTQGGELPEPKPHVVMSGWRMTPDYMNFKILIAENNPDGGSDGGYGYGVQVTNGEVSNASVSAARLFMRTSCFNSVTERNRDWRIMHSGKNDFESMAWRESKFIVMLGNALQQSGDLVERMLRSRQQQLPGVLDALAKIVEAQSFPEEVTNYAMAGTEQQESLFGLVNGLTYAAHQTPDLPPDTREDMEAFAGQVLSEFVPDTAGTGLEGDALAKNLFRFAGSQKHLVALEDGNGN